MVNWYEGDVTWKSAPIRLSLSMADCDDVERVLATAHALWDAMDHWNERVRAHAVDELLTLKNDSWREDGESELTADQFGAAMTLSSITVYPDGSFEFWHDDGDLFWGHAILVKGTLADGPNDAGIAG